MPALLTIYRVGLTPVAGFLVALKNYLLVQITEVTSSHGQGRGEPEKGGKLEGEASGVERH